MTAKKSSAKAGKPTAKDSKDSKDIELLELKLEQMTELGRRAVADMENMKRRMEEDRSRMALFANIDLIRQILPILDNFKRAQAHTPENLPDTAKEWLTGVTQTFSQLQQTLQQTGIQEINAIGQQLDPNFHEAVLQDQGPQDQILEVLEPGYMLGDHVIRPAKVKVGMGNGN